MVGYRGGGDLPLDALDELTGREPVRHGDGVAHRLGARPAVADDGDAGDAEQRRAAVFRVVDAPAEMPQRPPRQQRSDAHRDRARQLLAQQILHHVDEPLADLQRDVAGEAVADDHVGVAAVDIARLDVADELQRRALSSRCASRVSSLPLRLFLADRQQPDARRLDAECHARVDAAHHRELQQMLPAGIRRSPRRRAAPPDGRSSGSWRPAPADRRPAACPNAACAAMTEAPV